MKNPLPPLSALGNFEAAARHLSFTQAAKEFDVLQPTISRHIAALESDLGTALFIRKNPKLELTRDGETRLTAISSGFGQIAHGANIIRDHNSTQSFVVTASLGFASCFLNARLITPVDQSWDLWFDKLDVTQDFMTNRNQPNAQERESF